MWTNLHEKCYGETPNDSRNFTSKRRTIYFAAPFCETIYSLWCNGIPLNSVQIRPGKSVCKNCRILQKMLWCNKERNVIRNLNNCIHLPYHSRSVEFGIIRGTSQVIWWDQFSFRRNTFSILNINLLEGIIFKDW